MRTSGVAHDRTTIPGDCHVNGLLDAYDRDSEGDGMPDDGDLDANGIVDGSASDCSSGREACARAIVPPT